MKTVKEMMSKLRRIADYLPVPIRNRLKDCINRGVKGCILEHRKSALIVAAALGLLLAFFIYNIVADSFDDTPTLKSNITILALSLPTLFTLWMFRTHDTHKQIKKTEENTNNSTFFECARMLATKDSPEYSGEGPVKKRIENSLPKKIALEQLAYLRRETSFDKKKIDLLTRNLFLNGKELNHAQLSGIDLSGSELKNTRLREADLRDAKLIGANLSRDKTKGQPSKTDLSWANLSGADLRGANLSGAKSSSLEGSDGDLEEALGRTKHGDGKPILEGAKYNSEPISTGTIYIGKTVFPDWLDSKEKRKEAKMRDVSEKLDR